MRLNHFFTPTAVGQHPDPRAASRVIVWRKGHLSVPNDKHHFPHQSLHSLQCHHNNQQCCSCVVYHPKMRGKGPASGASRMYNKVQGLALLTSTSYGDAFTNHSLPPLWYHVIMTNLIANDVSTAGRAILAWRKCVIKAEMLAQTNTTKRW